MLLTAFAIAGLQTWPRLFIDATEKTPISRYIYGSNSPEWGKMGVPFPLARQGGNRLTAYNWETNASNAGNDWHNQNDGLMGETNEAGWAVRTFLESTQSHGAAAIVTIQTAGHVAADKKGDGDVNQTPDYIHTRFLPSKANKPGAKYAYPPDLKDSVVYEDEQVHWLESVKSSKTPVWYMLDNEPDIWASTHSRIVPKTPTYAEIIANNIEYAGAIKRVAPKSMVFGPANYGWQGFRRFQDASDAQNRDFLDVYLKALGEAEKKAGKRLLDVLDIHWYPEAQGDGVRIVGGPDKPGTPVARIQAPRSLWDPTYTETSWITKVIDKPIALLPGLMAQIRANYPGTKLSISEYNYGGGTDISGALAQADVLGIFGRYGLFAACNWGISSKDTAQVAGFKAFLDYDGKGSRFGDQGLTVKGEKPDLFSVYAALNSTKVLTLVVVNKSNATMPLSFDFKAFAPKAAKAYSFTAESLPNSKTIDTSLTDESVTITARPESVTTVEVHS